MKRMAARRHELLTDLADQAKHLLIEYGIKDEVATQVGHGLADHLAAHWGGETICFPKDCAFEFAKRDFDLWNDFDGSNHATLANKYEIGLRAVYKIIKKMRERQIALAQPGLFADLDESKPHS